MMGGDCRRAKWRGTNFQFFSGLQADHISGLAHLAFRFYRLMELETFSS